MSRKLEGLTEKWLQAREDYVLDEIKAEIHKVGNRFIAKEATVLERYVEGAIYLKAIVVLNKLGDERDFGLDVRIERAIDGYSESPRGWRGNDQFGVPTVGVDEMRDSVLVSVRQRVQDGDSVHRSGYADIDSRTRVHKVDQEFCVLGDVPKEFVPCRLVLVGVRGGRELSPGAGRGGLVQSDERTDDVVKSGSSIVDAVADQNAKSNRGLLLDGQLNSHTARLQVCFDVEGWFALLEVNDRFFLKDFQVLACPNDLMGDGIEICR